MGRPWRDPGEGDQGCCCNKIMQLALIPPETELSHYYDVEEWPHPYTVEEETFGGATIDSYTIRRGAPAEYQPPGMGIVLKTGKYSLQIDMTVTAPAGRWNAWLILWIPSSSPVIQEVIDVTDPDGIVLLNGIAHGLACRMRKQSRNVSSGAFSVFGAVTEYDGVRYYTPYKYITDTQDDGFGGTIPDRPHCWRALSGNNRGETITGGTLRYSGVPLGHDCYPDPEQLDRFGIVVGLTTVAEDPADDRDVEGEIFASLNLDNIFAFTTYSPHCPCWFRDPTLTSLTATFETAPTEIQGTTITLNRQPDNSFTASGTYGPDSLPFTLTYNPCVSLVIEFSDCDESANPLFPSWTLTATHQPFNAEDFNGYQASSVWQPINVVYVTRACIAPPTTPGSTGYPECGLTSNTTLPVGSPPFITLWNCWLFSIRLEE